MATPAKLEFEAIRRSKVYEEVAKQLERLILKKLQPGDKLPAERELAEMFGVSRSSIRDAIRSLELVGLVEPRQGAGTVVREVSAESLVSPLTTVLARQQVSELLDFRKMLEPPLERACHRRRLRIPLQRRDGLRQQRCVESIRRPDGPAARNARTLSASGRASAEISCRSPADPSGDQAARPRSRGGCHAPPHTRR